MKLASVLDFSVTKIAPRAPARWSSVALRSKSGRHACAASQSVAPTTTVALPRSSARVFTPDVEPYISNSGDLTRAKIAKLVEMVIEE